MLKNYFFVQTNVHIVNIVRLLKDVYYKIARSIGNFNEFVRRLHVYHKIAPALGILMNSWEDCMFIIRLLATWGILMNSRGDCM